MRAATVVQVCRTSLAGLVLSFIAAACYSCNNFKFYRKFYCMFYCSCDPSINDPYGGDIVTNESDLSWRLITRGRVACVCCRLCSFTIFRGECKLIQIGDCMDSRTRRSANASVHDGDRAFHNGRGTGAWNILPEVLIYLLIYLLRHYDVIIIAASI